MAAITKNQVGSGFRRAGTAQADTGQTDWIERPQWATKMVWTLDITAVAGTTPILTPALLAADPITADDANVIAMATFTTPPTAAGTHVMEFGPGTTGIADDLALAATGDSKAAVNVDLPDLIGVQLTLDRTTGNETYTYTLNVSFHR